MQQRLNGTLDTMRVTEPPKVRVAQTQKPREWLCSVPLVPHEQLQKWMTRLLDWPADFHPHPKVKLVLARPAELVAGCLLYQSDATDEYRGGDDCGFRVCNEQRSTSN